MTQNDIGEGMSRSLTLAASKTDHVKCASGGRNENAHRTFATAKWRPLADARGRHETHRHTDSVPTPYQGRVQGACVYTRMFRNITYNQSIH